MNEQTLSDLSENLPTGSRDPVSVLGAVLGCVGEESAGGSTINLTHRE